MLNILGGEPNAAQECGQEIHKELVCRQNRSTSGLNKDLRKELNSNYLTPSKCSRCAAPVTSIKIKAALLETLIKPLRQFL